MIVKEKGIGDGYVVRRVIALSRELGDVGKKLVLKRSGIMHQRGFGESRSKLEEETFLEHSPVRSSGAGHQGCSRADPINEIRNRREYQY